MCTAIQNCQLSEFEPLTAKLNSREPNCQLVYQYCPSMLASPSKQVNKLDN
uniref:Uncharacterized protein n=1 Tax=Arundo donax TaxID=35708 RepID=A0A0A9GL59_ARUDO